MTERIRVRKKYFLIMITLVLLDNADAAEMASDVNATATDKESPWLATPLLSSAPKLGTSVGALGAHISKFDAESPASMFGVAGTYSTTDSYVVGIFARTYFDKDRQRLTAGLAYGKINNEYNDFLGTGHAVMTTDDLHAAAFRYAYRFSGDWFIGLQGVMANYIISGNNLLSELILGFIGLDGFNSNGVGAVVERDTRDNQNSPASGSHILLNNLAFRTALGGEENFDIYTVKTSKYFGHYNGNVLAVRLDGQWSVDAPAGAYATVNLRGYTPGQYLAPYMTMFEAEERIAVAGRWGAEVFAGIAALYGNEHSGTDWFPSAGAGVNYMLKEEEKMVVRAEAAAGQSGNYGLYLQFGWGF